MNTVNRTIGFIRVPFTYIFLVLFFSGIFFMSTPLGVLGQKFFIASVVFYLLLKNQFNIRIASRMKYISFFVGALIVFSFTSAAIHFESFFKAILISQKYVFLLLCLYIANHVGDFLNRNRSNFVHERLLIVLVVSQLFFAIVKFGILGKIDEGFMIGTMHHNAGQLGFLFSAAMIPLVVFVFGRSRRWLVLAVLVMFLFLFSILNEKRSIFYLGLPILLVSVFVVSDKAFSLKNQVRIASITLSAGVLLLVLMPYIGSLSGRERLGDLDVSGILYLGYYALEYLTMDYGGSLQGSESDALFDTNVQVGRLIVWLKGLQWFVNLDFHQQLLGIGFGSITPSSYVNAADIMFSTLGFRGAISGSLSLLLEGGIVGLSLGMFIVLYPLRLLIKARRYCRIWGPSKRGDLQWCNILLIVWAVFAFDFFFYSETLLSTMPFPLAIFLLIYAVPTKPMTQGS